MSRLSFMNDCEAAIQTISDEIAHLEALVASGEQPSAHEIAWLSEMIESVQHLRDRLIARNAAAAMTCRLHPVDARHRSDRSSQLSIGRKHNEIAGFKQK